MTGLGFLNGGSDSGAYGVSDDGAYVVGQSMYTIGGGEEGTTYTEAFVWHGGTMSGLGFLGGGTSSYATAITPDATKIVGVADDAASNRHMVRWVSDGLGGYTLQDLGQLGMNAWANAVSADGNTVVGYSTVGNTFPDDQRAMFWSANGGMQLLQTVLTNQGVDLTGWILYDATDISADGTKIVGYGRNTSGQQEAFYAEIAPVPEPSTLLTTGSLIAAAWLRRRRRAN